MLGVTEDIVGLEWDAAACKTAKAAGHARIRCDVTEYPTDAFGRGNVKGLIGSPSCTLFSAAGNGVGNLVTDLLTKGIVAMMHGDDTRVEVREAIYPTTLKIREAANAKRAASKRWTQQRVETQARSDAFVACLVLEPARYIHNLGVEWVALEQVPEVLPLWRVYVRELRALGYSAWTGVLNAADYGVPQTRQRAILMASRTRAVQPPTPTHAKDPQGADLFGGEIEGWVSMATALGWEYGLDINTRGDRKTSGGNEFSADRPSWALTSKVRSWWCFERPATTVVGSFCPDVIAAPGYRTKISRQNAPGSVRVAVGEAGILQSFPTDYPWQGSRSKQFEQVGNAIPPRLAMHVLAALGVGAIRSEVAA